MYKTIANVFGAASDSDPLRRWVPYSSFIAPEVFLTKTGAVGMALSLEGFDYETKTQEHLEQVSKKLTIANRVFGTNFRIYHHLFKRQGAAIARKESYGNPVVEQLVSERARHLESKRLYNVKLFTTILFEGRSTGFPILDRLLEQRLRREVNSQLTKNIAVLQDAVNAYVAQLRDLLGIYVLNHEETFQYFRLLLNPDETSLVRLKYKGDIDYFAADTAISSTTDGLCWGDFNARVFALKEEPDSTFAHLLRNLLRIDGNFHLTVEWRPTDRAPMIHQLNLKRQQVYGQRKSAVQGALGGDQSDLLKDLAASENAERLNEAIRQMRNRGNYFCDCSLSIIVFDRDPDLLRAASERMRQVFADKDGTLIQERDQSKRTFLAMLPGNAGLNIRYRSILNLNVSDLTPCYRAGAGQTTNGHLSDEYMTVMESADHTPVYLSPHYGEVASTLILGTTGSGKSMLLGQFIDDGQKYDPYTFVIDVGGSHRAVTTRHGGSYAQVRLNDKSFGVNPFRQPHNPQNVNFILEFIRVLLANEGHTLSPEHTKMVLNEIEAVYCLPEGRRRIGRMSLPAELRSKLHTWINGGPFSHFVDSERDDLILTRFQTWDFTDLEENPRLLGPVMWYVSRWISRIVTNPELADRAKACYMDEGWRFGDMEDFIRSAAKTWRKHRGWIVLSTQDVEDLQRNGLLELVNTCCPTKIFMSNPGASVAVYGDTFRFSERESELLGTMKIGEFIVKTPTDSKLCIYRPAPERLLEYQSQFEKKKELISA
jgi:type IV secretion system protein TrbE